MRTHNHIGAMKQLASLEAWNCANALARSAYRLTLRKPLSSHFGLSDQIRRAAVSEGEPVGRDRKSTRLNSSHLVISYAVFCLKKNTHRHARHRVGSYGDSPVKHERAQLGHALLNRCGERYGPLPEATAERPVDHGHHPHDSEL